MKKQKALVLSEFLITLGIIGAVTAVTTPVLYNQCADKIFDEKFENTYSLIARAHVAAIEHLGLNPSLWGLTRNGDEYGNIMSKQLLTLKHCKTSEGCFAKEYSAKEQSKYNYDSDPFFSKFVLNNGTVVGFNVVAPNCDLSDGSTKDICGYAVVDLNGSKKPNKLGQDLRNLYLTNSGVKSADTSMLLVSNNTSTNTPLETSSSSSSNSSSETHETENLTSKSSPSSHSLPSQGDINLLFPPKIPNFDKHESELSTTPEYSSTATTEEVAEMVEKRFFPGKYKPEKQPDETPNISQKEESFAGRINATVTDTSDSGSSGIIKLPTISIQPDLPELDIHKPFDHKNQLETLPDNIGYDEGYDPCGSNGGHGSIGGIGDNSIIANKEAEYGFSGGIKDFGIGGGVNGIKDFGNIGGGIQNNLMNNAGLNIKR